MKPLRLSLVGATLATLLACTDAPVAPPIDLSPACGADRLQGLVGQDIAVISETGITAPLRVIHPGMAVTADYRPDRLNIEADEAGIITRVWCA